MKLRKNLKVFVAGYSEKLWEDAIEDDLLPVLAMKDPERFKGTPIHFPDLTPKHDIIEGYPEETKDVYWDDLAKEISPWAFLYKLDLLAHLASSEGIVIMTSPEDSLYRELLTEYFNGILDNPLVEYYGKEDF